MRGVASSRGFLFATLAVFGGVFGAIYAQDTPPSPAVESSGFPNDYPSNQPGILIQGSSWQQIAGAMPFKTKIAHGIAASLSYGAVPAKIVAEYQGDHASTQVDAGQMTICICHIISLPGEPVIVRLHAKNGARELNGGKMIVYPVVGGSKMADASKSDLIPVDEAHPEPQVWLIRPQVQLPPGEYALMLGTQNINIFPFTVVEPAGASSGTKPNP
jgi:hypothetical protein